MRDFVVELRQQLVAEVKNLTAPGIQNGSQPLVLWKNRQYVANRMRYAGGALERLRPAGLAPGTAAAQALAVPERPGRPARYEAAFAPLLRDLPRRLLRVGACPRLSRPEEGEAELGAAARAPASTA